VIWYISAVLVRCTNQNLATLGSELKTFVSSDEEQNF
jgi:hypothetical protein